ncbi:DnaD domain-containing protein [Brevibacillus centrosporus]|uniref:DnaD domain-containing protein n=1 Tax=Brevibacillus centrosporus TaxID=54910 RepID=UPI0039864158
MSKLLLDDQPLFVLPSLAKVIGLNESIFLQQLHYWLERSAHNIDGRKWVYNTIQKWQEQFPFWGYNTIRRIVEKLEKGGVILTGNYNQSKIDKTTWYSIDYEKLDELTRAQSGQIDCENSQSTAQVGQMESPDRVDGEPNVGKAIPEITTEITTEIKADDEEDKRASKPDPFFIYQQEIGVVSPFIAEDISKWIEENHFDQPHEIITEAIKVAVMNGAPKWKYVTTVLNDWTKRGLRTLAQVNAYQIEVDNQRERGETKREKGSAVRRGADPNVPSASITNGRTGWINKPGGSSGPEKV